MMRKITINQKSNWFWLYWHNYFHQMIGHVVSLLSKCLCCYLSTRPTLNLDERSFFLQYSTVFHWSKCWEWVTVSTKPYIWDLYQLAHHPAPTGLREHHWKEAGKRLWELEDGENCYEMLSSVHDVSIALVTS